MGRAPSPSVTTLAAQGVEIEALVTIATGALRATGGSPARGRATTVQIYEPAVRIAPGAVVLGIGIEQPAASSVVEKVASSGAAALVLRQQAIDEEVESACEAHGLLLLELHVEADWAYVFRVLDSFVRGHDGGALGELLHRADNLQGLARVLAERLGNPLTIENLRCEVLAYSAHDDLVDAARQHTILAGSSPPEILNRMRKAGVFRRIHASPEPLRFDDTSIGVERRVAAAVREGEHVLGYIWVMEANRELDPEDFVLLRQATRLAAVYFVRDSLERDLDRRTRDEFLQDLLDGEIATSGLIAVRAKAVGLDPHRGTVPIVIRFHVPSGDDDAAVERGQAASLRRLLDVVSFEASAFHPAALAARVDDDILVLAPVAPDGGARAQELGERLLAVCRTVLPELRYSVGLGAYAADVVAVPEAYRLAIHAVRVADRVRGGNVVLAYDDLGAYRLLAEALATGALDSSLSGAVDALAEYDAKHHGEYCRTLEVYLDSFGDRARTSSHLHIHLNTLAYRLKRIEEIGGIDLADPESRLAAQLEFRARGFRATSDGSRSG